MLRPKHIGHISNTARSFILGGSRCSAADGSSCTCTDDDTCVSQRQDMRRKVLQNDNSPAFVKKASTVVGSLLSGDAAKKPASHKPEVFDHSPALPQAVPVRDSLRRSHSVNYAGNIEQEFQASEAIGDQVLRAGIAAVNFLSDLVNYKLPLSDGSGIVSCMVDPTRSVSNVKSSNVKGVKRENFKVYPKSSSKVQSGQNPSSSYRFAKDKGEKPASVRGFKPASNASVNPAEGQCANSGISDNRKHVHHKQRPYSNGFTPAFDSRVQASESNSLEGFGEGFSKRPRDVNTTASGFGPKNIRQFKNAGRVVESVSDILRRFRWGPAAEQALRNLNFSMNAFQANQVLKNLDDHMVALEFFYWLKRQPGFRHDGHTYTTMVGLLGRAKKFVEISRLLDQMMRDGCQPNTVTYNRLIHSYGRANYLNEALKVFNEMQEAGCEPDRVTYCTLIDIHAKAGYLDVAMDMYQRMQAAGLTPDTFTYSVIINCLGKAGHLPAAHRLFCEMVGHGCVPNLVTYNIMIALHAKARNYESALKLYRDMQNAGFEPDKVTYSIVMEVLGHCGYLEEAEDVFTEMRQKSWIPDEPVYGLLVDLWGKAGNVEKAWQWYQAMLQAGLRPNVPTCNSLLSAFLRAHRLPEAYCLLQNMLALGLNPSLQTYTLLLSCCTEAQSAFEMGFCCQLMAVTGHPAHMFLLSMPSAGPDGQNVRDHVSRFLDLLHSEDRESKRGLVDAVVDFLHKTGLKEEAGSVWEVAALRNVYPDAVKEKSSSYWLINLHVMSEGTAVTALSRTLAWFRRQMLASGGVGPSRIDIVTGWGRRSRVTGMSLVRQAVRELLDMFRFPFFVENSNSGCFVGYGEALNEWLLQSYVERMHLL